VDASGVVNITAYAQYMYHARCSILEGIGMPIEDLQVRSKAGWQIIYMSKNEK
jgi:acyl-CoA thioesterase FadM